MLGSIGKALNSLTGASASQSKAHQSSKSLANLSYEQQKEFAKNAHQWEMEDLQKAGLNPALTTGASSAGAIAGGGATGGSSAGSSGGLNLLSTIADIYNNTRLTNAQIDQLDAQTEGIDANTDQTEGGLLSRILGTGMTNKIKEIQINRKATSAKRKQELDKRNKEESYLKKLLTFEAKKIKR